MSVAAAKDKPTPRVFISYRREDSRDITSRIADALREQDAFYDVRSIEGGMDWPNELRRRIDQD